MSNGPSLEVRAALVEMRRALESIPRLTPDAREAVWSAFGHLRDVLYREADERSRVVTFAPSPVLTSFPDSPIVIAARAGE